jgi:hypothetical protein
VHVRLSRETPRTRFDTFTGGVDNPEFLTIIFKIMRPPPKAGRDLQDRPSCQVISNTRQDGAGPLCGGTAPRLGPFLACILPIVLRFLRMAQHTPWPKRGWGRNRTSDTKHRLAKAGNASTGKGAQKICLIGQRCSISPAGDVSSGNNSACAPSLIQRERENY